MNAPTEKTGKTAKLLKSGATAILLLAAVAVVGGGLADTTSPATDIPRFEPGEDRPGGAATSTKLVNADSFSHSSANLPFEKELDFKLGNAMFRRLWVAAPASTKSADGLGPLFNARSCQRCHLKDGRGHPPSAPWPQDNAVSFLLRLSIPPQNDAEGRAVAEGRAASIPEPVYGGQLQDFALAGLDPEGQIHIRYSETTVTLAGGETVTLRKPEYSVIETAFGPLHPDTMISPRVAPPMIGLGLIERIPEQDIRALADPDDRNGDGISGRAQIVWDLAKKAPALGRFGWKAGNPTIRQQTADAFAHDIGISTPLVPKHWGDCTAAQTGCRNMPSGASQKGKGHEVADNILDLVTFYSQNLAVPQRRDAKKPDVLRGKTVFHDTGCAACHVPQFVTGEDPEQPWLSQQTIRPFTDLLLHDMGVGLADNRPDGVADGREWRTPPLWGIGLTETVSGHSFFLHDGRARNLLEAILWHDGEAARSTKKVRALPKADRDALLAFLRSL